MTIGVPIPWPSAVVPTGYLQMRGQSFDPSAYPELAVLFTDHILLDLRGEFIRGWDNGRGVDAGRTLLALQADEFKTHSHAQTYGGGWDTPYSGVPRGGNNGNITSLHTTTATGGNETRPRNISFMYITRVA